MKASETNLGKIAERTAQYLVPLFQRPYSWEKKQWQELLTDLIDLCDTEGSHFIGSIVVTDIASKPKDLTYYYLLIDGQQRLTTLFVILILLRDIADNKIPTKIKRLLTNEVVEGLEHFTLLPLSTGQKINRVEKGLGIEMKVKDDMTKEIKTNTKNAFRRIAMLF